MNDLVAELLEKTCGYGPEKLLEYVLRHFSNRIALASSFGPEDQVLTDMICKISGGTGIFTLDTGRLCQENYDVMEATRSKYGIEIETIFPDSQKVSEMVSRYGPNLFYESVENRKLCCGVRKVEPLKKKLARLDGWICGLRKEQSITRDALQPIEWDDAFGLVKICPLAEWTTRQVWDYIRRHSVPYNALCDKGYPSIGCAPCTRAVRPGDDIRSGRWWWEQPEHKECGLHCKDRAGNTDGDGR